MSLNTQKILIVREPSFYLKLVGRIYIILDFLNKVFFGISFLALIATGTIYLLYQMQNRLLLAIAISGTFLSFVFAIIFYVMRDNVSPESEIEKKGLILANQLKKNESEIEVSRLKGEVVKVTKGFGCYHIKIRLENQKNLRIRFEGELRNRFSEDISLISKEELENLVGKSVNVRQSSIKLKKYGWLRDHASVSVLDDNKKTRFKFETFDPSGDLFKGRKIFG